jgi:hypothetical protein
LKLALFSGRRELDAAPRQFLMFNLFNVISWQCIVGPAMILLARAIDMPASWVGFLISFMPLSTLAVVLTVPLVTYWGSKKLMFSAWMVRNIVAGLVFLMPLAIYHWGQRAGWYVLMAATLSFCVVRALGAGGWFPWIHEVVPERQRGLYFSTEAAQAHFVNVVVIVGQGIFLSRNPSVNQFLVIYAIGICAGMISLGWMLRVPGGGAVLDEGQPTWAGYRGFRLMLEDRPYLAFILTTGICFSSTAWLGSAIILYMRDILGLPSNAIMGLVACGSGGILLTIRAWGRFAEHSGSGTTMFLSLLGHGLAALACLAVLPGRAWSMPLLVAVIVLANIFGAAFWIAAHRAMLNYVKPTGRIAYTNFWTVGTAIALGVTPILVGQVIDRWHLHGFQLCFIIAGIAGIGSAVASRLVIRDGMPVRRGLTALFDPALPVRTFARIAWITIGLHESNRPASKAIEVVAPAPQHEAKSA